MFDKNEDANESSQLRVDIDELSNGDDDEWLYDDKPFTGVAYELFENGSLHAETTCVDGIEQGLCREWYSTGQLKEQFFALLRRSPDVWLKWHENGVLAQLTECECGIEVRDRLWDSHGQLIEDTRIDENHYLYGALQKLKKEAAGKKKPQ